MSRALIALATVLGLLVGGGVAWAAWTSSGPGSATARANTLGTPTATASAWTCGTTPSGFAASGRGVESFGEQVVTTTTATPRAATTTTTTAAPPPATTTTTTPSITTAVPTSTSSAAPTTTTTVSPTTSTSGAVSGLGAAAATLRWSAVPGAAAYQFQAAPTADFAVPSTGGTTSGLSSTVTVRALLVRVTVYLRVRAVSGAWSGPWSPTLTTTAGPCLAG
ncbi:hypothetical protein [Actinomycetospora termitidis]|uniref:Fibronectin type-III domain-containing protein n=1 Tax=Actinomycetospora termitidis TaxID=3053470 RepID=A0ABT7M557_9PSEU|nr:hypothetical protein [Actinomycetospora sp. Odt1-22]MDL5155815.1 hypothetical protein [Actinomycetospora sp. Odt1-22]